MTPDIDPSPPPGGAVRNRPPRADVRLVVPVVGAWAAAGSVLIDQGQRWLVVLALVGGMAGALLPRLVAGRRGSPAGHSAAARVVAVGCAAGAAVATVAALHVSNARSGPLAGAAGARSYVVLEAVVSDDPRRVQTSTSRGAARSFLVVRASARSVALYGRRWQIRQPTLLIAPDAPQWRRLLPSQRVRVAGVAEPPRGHDVLAAVVAVRGPPELEGRPSRLQRLAGVVRAGLQRATSGIRQPVGGLLPGLVDGDTSRLDPVLGADFRTAGMTHLVAVSGANIAIVVSAALALARRMRASLRTAAVVGVVSLLAFVVVARPSPSVVRAGAMSAVLLLGVLTGRRGAPLPALLGSVLVLLLASPPLALQPGFALSVAATAGILLLGPPMARSLRSAARWLPTPVADLAAVAAAAHVACLPVLVALWGQLSVTAVPANMLAEPAVPPATILGVLAAVASAVCLPVAQVLARLAAVPAQWLVVVATHAAALPSATASVRPGLGPALLVTSALVVGWLAMRRPATRRALVAGVLGCGTALVGWHTAAPGWPPGGWVLVACDVGQGDGLVLRAGDHAAVVVDTGPEPTAISSCLRRLGVRRVPVVVLTHFHADHVGGLAGVLVAHRPSEVLVSPLPEPPAEAAEVRAGAARAGIPVHVARPGERFVVGTATLDVLGPTRVLHGTDSDPNNDSLVLRAADHGVRLLLTGDVQAVAQHMLVNSGARLGADILKVPHHGSANQDPAFLAAVHARAALVSVGADNTYGQPAPSALRELSRDGMATYRTDLNGDIAVVARSGRIAIVPARSSSSSTAALPRERCRGCAAVRGQPRPPIDGDLAGEPGSGVASIAAWSADKSDLALVTRVRGGRGHAVLAASSGVPRGRGPPSCAAAHRSVTGAHGGSARVRSDMGCSTHGR